MADQPMFSFDDPFKRSVMKPKPQPTGHGFVKLTSEILSEVEGDVVELRASGDLILYLASQPGRPLHIGKLVRGTLYLERWREKGHWLWKHDGYGVNYSVMHRRPDIKYVVFRDERGEWVIPGPRVRDCPCIRHKFAANGKSYELQHVVPLDDLEEL